jgi:hypothetical protein
MKRLFQIPNAGAATWLSKQAWGFLQPFPTFFPACISRSESHCSPLSPENLYRSTVSFLPKTPEAQPEGAAAEMLPVSYRPFSSGRTNLPIEGRW